ncbi:MAG: CPBP family intramembrane metalloprotease [Tannerella sp.]|jgi:membrane protease YdiL (CAAX protease family)|nr:CPBP family intramembrane metalloprotease [Tannerella sp.]
MKGLFSNRSALFQAGVLLYFLLMGLVFSSITGYAMMRISGSIPENIPFYIMQATQFMSNIFVFVLPAAGTAYFCCRNPAKFLCMRKITDVRVLILAAAMIFLISPAVDATIYLNSQMHLPEFMAPVENWMRETEDHATQITEKVLSEDGIFPFIINIIVIGVMAGLTEEFLFRGALLSIIRIKIKNPHIAIWIVAILFSAIHFQFYGFIPRMLSGAVLGYLLYWSNNIWVPAFAHFLNNTVAVVGHKTGIFQNESGSSTLITNDIKTEDLLITGAIAIVGLILSALCAKIMRKICMSPESC